MKDIFEISTNLSRAEPLAKGSDMSPLWSLADLKTQLEADLTVDFDDITNAMNFRLSQRRHLGTSSGLGKALWGGDIGTFGICDFCKHVFLRIYIQISKGRQWVGAVIDELECF